MKKGLALAAQLLLILSMLIPSILTPGVASADALYSKTITVDHTKIPSPQSGFPLLISLTDATLADTAHSGHVANSDGSDIYFTNPSGAIQYPCEIERYDSYTGTLVAWVKVDLSSSADTKLKLWYGGSSVTSNVPSNVWDSNFKGVWHMNQVSASDSTVNANNGTAGSGITEISSGKIDGADSFTNPGLSTEYSGTPSYYIDCGNGSSLDFSASGSYTWEAWIYVNAASSGPRGLFGKTSNSSGSWSGGYDIFVKTNGNAVTIQDPGNSNSQAYSGALSGDTWHHIAVAYNSKSASTYVDGALSSSGTLSSMSDDTSSNVYIGFRRSKSNGAGLFNGSIDEVKYSSTLRSADWILTEYRNQNNPSAFYAVGNEDSDVMPTPSPIPTPTPTPTQPSWDLNNDHVCNIGDVGVLGSYWHQRGSGGWIPQDLNGDGVINIGDVGVLGSHWYQTW